MTTDLLAVEYRKVLAKCAKSSLWLHELLFCGLETGQVAPVFEKLGKELISVADDIRTTESSAPNPIYPVMAKSEILKASTEPYALDFEKWDALYLDAMEKLNLIAINLMDSRPSAHADSLIHIYACLKVNTAIINYMSAIESLQKFYKRLETKNE